MTREVEYKASGTFGEGFTWTLTEDGVLTISGTGAMEDFSGVAARPWQTYKDEIVKVIIEEGITRVGSRTCTNIPNLAEVELAESVKELAANSFNTTPALKSINLENVTSIGTMAFQRSGLTEVRLKDCAVTDTAFRQCESLTAATFEGEVTIGNSAFLGTALESLDLSNVKNCGTAFVGLSTLKSVTIGSKLTELSLSGTGITELTVPANLQTYLFSLNTSLETVTIEDGVTVIPDSAFGGDTALKTVSIPATVTTIAENAFNTCDALTTINFGGTRAQWEAIGYTAAEGVTVHCIDDGESVEVIAISLDKDEMEIRIGDEPVELIADVQPENATNRTVFWESSDDNIASVKDGIVTAVAEGEVVITASAGGCSVSCIIKVLPRNESVVADLTGFTFSFTTAYSTNQNYYHASEAIKQDDGQYIVDVDYHALTQSKYSLIITAPNEDIDFNVHYTSYKHESGSYNYSYAHSAKAQSTNGSISINDYYAVEGKPDGNLVYSGLCFTLGDKEANVILQPVVCKPEINSIKDSNGTYYPINEFGNNSFSVSAPLGLDLTVSINPNIRNYVQSVAQRDYLTVYIDGEKHERNYGDYVQFSALVSEEDQTFHISLVDENYGIKGYDYDLTIKAAELSTPVLYYNGEQVPSTPIKITAEQYSDLVLTVEGKSVDENTVYRWYQPGQTIYELEENNSTLHFDTSNPGIHQVVCEATNVIDGVDYTSLPAHFTITVLAKEYAIPTIVTQPTGANYIKGNTADKLFLEVQGNERIIIGRSFEFQWYKKTGDIDSVGVKVDSPRTKSLLNTNQCYEDSIVPNTNTAGDYWYYCEVREFGPDVEGRIIYSEPAITDSVLIRVTETYIDLKGRGTEDDPYLIGTYDELKQLHDLVNDGSAFNNTNFRMTADIALASDWTPMGITVDGTNNVADAENLHAFSGIFDGDGHTLTIYPGGQPLLGYIENATVKNLNIYGERINGYGLVNNLYGVRIAGTGITVDNVTLKSGSSTLKSGLLGGEIDWQINPYSSASAHFMSYVSNCTIESGVVVGYDGSQSKIGSIAGSFNGIMENCVSYATVNGVDNVGGLVGYKDNSGGGDKFSVLNSAFYGTVNASGKNAGGIVGGGYNDVTAPNSGGVNIKNCTSSGTVNGNKNVGGILGAEDGIDQLWDASYIQSNYFSGKVTGNENVGAIIGYMGALDKYNFIENNTFTAGCGSDKTFGKVHMVDTSAVEKGWHDGTYYYDSSRQYSDEEWNEIFDVMWQPWEDTGRWKPSLSMNFRLDHNRDDDPLGVNSGDVPGPVDPDKPRILSFNVSGNFKTEYTVGDTLDLAGIVFTAGWSDGSTTNPGLSEVQVSGFDSTSQGDRTLIFKYEGLSATAAYTVKPQSNKITVALSILGDSVHGSSGTIHTLKDGNLTTWLGAKTYEASTSDTVFDLLQRVFAQYGITYKGDGSYISALTYNGTNLGEFSTGTNSGWMYTVNGHHPLLAVGEQYLNDGDVIIFHYSDDYTVEEGSEGFDNTDAQAAQEVEQLIAAIPTPVTPASRPVIEAARAAYDNLNYGQKAKVGNYDKLVAAEEALKAAERAEAEANATPADRAAAEAVEKLIDAIKTPVTADQADAVKAAREAYDKLTDLQKKLVDNLDKLEQAETALTSMKEEVNLRKIHSDTGDAIEAKGDLDVNGQWLAIGLARAGRKVNKEAFYASAEEYVKQEINEDEQLHWAKVTENARMVLALTALGYDPTDVAGHNLLMGMTDMEYVKMQGFNGPIWTLIAFDSNQYEIPENPDAKDQVTREKLISYLLENQLEDGGWALFGNLSDSDITGMTLQALAPYYGKRDDVTKAVDIALETLSRMQNADGSYSALGGDNGMEPTSESIAQILVALSALGIDADKDPRFIKNGNSILDALCSYYTGEGGFKHVLYGQANGMATEQAYYALTAYFRMLDGKNSLYDMTDVTIAKAERTAEPETADTSETAEEDAALAVDAAEETQEKKGISPLWIIPPVAAAGIIAFLVADRKRRKDNQSNG
ncbi:MAG: leucine-rich repeat protein [Eubacterium sp.]|nr:leucine-rich repeat protein [Eubacterium sp.]